MLKVLNIHHFTLISEASVCFDSGFTAITGETGSGKSVLLKALRAVLGDKTPPSVVRNGEEKAWIEAEFDVTGNTEVQAVLEELGIDFENELIIRRDILTNGKGRARINGTVVNLSDLQLLGETLVQMHGQSEQLMLRDVRSHTKILDAYCNNKEYVLQYKDAFSKWNACKAAIEKAKAEAETLAAQKDFLQFQFKELREAELREGEEAELQEKTAEAGKAEVENKILNELKELLEKENGLLDSVNLLESKIRHLASKLPRYELLHEQYQEVADSYESFLKELLRLSPENAVSEAELNRANARLAKIQRLKRKYKTDEAGLIALCSKREAELQSLENFDSDLEELLKNEKFAKQNVDSIAKILSARRHAGAATLDAAVEKELHLLGMTAAHFKTEILPSEPAAVGADRIEFLIAPNRGEGERSLQKAVSGGELSRVLLAFKTVTAESDSVPLLIFDEVDSGISGEIGNKIGDALQRLGKMHQVFTITHLHQVASRAKHQIAVSKTEIEERTFTHIKNLNSEERVTELVRMLGESDSLAARQHAEHLLENQND